MTDDVETLKGVLRAYQEVATASWPSLHPDIAAHAARWSSAGATELRRELDDYMRRTSAPGCTVRVFWKLAPTYAFGGCNEHFAHDAGLPGPAQLIGLTDFDKRLPWHFQASKYRQDDEQVVAGRAAKLDIIERQKSPSGDVSWVRVGKAPIRDARGAAIGVLGMYELLDPALGRRLYAEQLRR